MNKIVTGIKAEIQLGEISVKVFEIEPKKYLYGYDFLAAVGGFDKKKLSQKTSKYHISRLCNPCGEKNSISHKVKVEGISEPYKTLADKQISEALGALAKSGNEKAISVLVACTLESLERRADKAFGHNVSEEERNRRIDKRVRVMNQSREQKALYGDKACNQVAKFLGVSRGSFKLANFFHTYIYDVLTPEEKAKLNRENPIVNGSRKETIHSWLEQNLAEDRKQHFNQILTILEVSVNEEEFKLFYRRKFGREFQMSLF